MRWFIALVVFIMAAGCDRSPTADDYRKQREAVEAQQKLAEEEAKLVSAQESARRERLFADIKAGKRRGRETTGAEDLDFELQWKQDLKDYFYVPPAEGYRLIGQVVQVADDYAGPWRDSPLFEVRSARNSNDRSEIERPFVGFAPWKYCRVKRTAENLKLLHLPEDK